MNDIISRQAAIVAIKNCESGENFEYNEGLIAAMNAVVDTPSAQEWILFAHWVAKEVIDEENWDTNSISFPEVVCRKLFKLGIIDTDGEKWIYTPPKEERA